MKNEKGQVGIFVALIFQVIFVFFAMLINVGLVVHHKINLQQSTDLAAYYGAMKQAEIMNAMAHVNFQIRQAWKLLSWRYRVLGTFGMERQNSTGPDEIQFPIQWNNTGKLPTYNSGAETFKCNKPNVMGLTLADVPFMCMGHAAFADWVSPDTTDNTETFCKMNCGHMDGFKTTIGKIAGVGNFAFQAANMGGAINQAIDKTNAVIKKTCNMLAPISMQMLSLFYSNYIVDTGNKARFIKMLEKNLSLSEKEILDLEGKKIFTGVENTFLNNLTEANKSGKGVFETYNGAKNLENKLLNQINFQYLQFFMVYCQMDASETKNFSLKALFNNGAFDPDLKSQANIYQTNLGDNLEKIFSLNNENSNTIGFEKNPWAQVYYGVKATAEPKIPFLPIAKIKLHAISFAKPFGGSIGPWYVKTWASGAKSSYEGDSNYNHRVDINLPRIGISNDPSLNTLKGSREITVNYSNYVGDTYSNAAGDGLKGGLSNIHLVAIYNNMLANKFVPNNTSTEASKNKTEEVADRIKTYKKPTIWPRYSEWLHLAKDVDDPDFDPMALSISGPVVKNTFMRDIEMTVVAPNQFDLTYYSIDSNFYQTYYKDRLNKDNALQNIKNATGMTTPEIVFPKDFGYNGKLINNGIPPDFSVRHQLQVVNEIFKNNKNLILGIHSPNVNDSGGGKSYFFTFIPKFQSSLLTSWTFNDFKDYNSFPSPDNAKSRYTMQFGTCSDEWSATSDGNTPVYLSPSDDKPAVPGNCVTGGRVGYSVKLISTDMVREGVTYKGLGGPGTEGPILNPVDESFLRF